MIPRLLQFMLTACGIEPSIADIVIRTLSFLWHVIA